VRSGPCEAASRLAYWQKRLGLEVPEEAQAAQEKVEIPEGSLLANKGGRECIMAPVSVGRPLLAFWLARRVEAQLSLLAAKSPREGARGVEHLYLRSSSPVGSQEP
jgi:hypothetical protein